MQTERPTHPERACDPALDHADDSNGLAARGQCRHVVQVAVNAMLDMASEIARDNKVSLGDLRRIAAALLGEGGPLTNMCTVVEHNCLQHMQRISVERQRRDAIGRLIVEPFAHLLDQPNGIERKRLGQLLLAFRMMLGEELYDTLRTEASALTMQHRGADGIVQWESFHHDPKAAQILETVQVHIARSFHRFDGRRDWFLVVLNSSPSAVSTGSTSFVPLKPEERAKLAFTQRHMAEIFDALFASVRRDTFTADRLRSFSQRWNVNPDKVFANFFVELAHLRMMK